MIQLYPRIEDTTQAGEVITDARDAVVSCELRGGYSLRFKTARPLELWQMLKATTQDGDQPFYVADVQDVGELYEITANHVCHLLAHVHIDAIKTSRGDVGAVVAQLNRQLQNNPMRLPFRVVAEGVTGAHELELEHVSALDVLQKGDHCIASEWDCKVLYSNFTIRLVPRQYHPTEHLIAKRKNLLEYAKGKSAGDIATRLHLYAKVREEKPGGEFGGETYEEKTIRATVDSPLAGSYPLIFERAVEVTEDDADTVDKLRAHGLRMFAVEGIDKPREEIQIRGTQELGEGIPIGGSALVYYERENTYSRVDLIAYEFDPIAEEYQVLNFGELPRSLNREIAKRIKKQTERMQALADRAEIQHREALARQNQISAATAQRFGAYNAAMDKANKIIEQQGNQLVEYSAELVRTQKEFQQSYKELRTNIDKTTEEFSTKITQTARKIESTASEIHTRIDNTRSEFSTRITQTARSIELVSDNVETLRGETRRSFADVHIDMRSITSTVGEVRSTANSAYNTANSAYNIGANAQSRVSVLEQTVNGWRYLISDYDSTRLIMKINGAGIIANVPFTATAGAEVFGNMYVHNRCTAGVFHSNASSADW